MMPFLNQFKISNWAPAFFLDLKYWYLSKMIPFLKYPLIPTFLLLMKARRCNKKTEMSPVKEPFTWEFFVIFLPHIWKENRKSHVKMYRSKFIFLKMK